MQMEVHPESQKLLIIATPWGLFKYTRLPFGLSVAPQIFQRWIDSILSRIENVGAYLDDIIVTGNTDTEHRRNLEMMLKRLRDLNVNVELTKCQLFKDKVEFLGYRLRNGCIEANDAKIKDIMDSPSSRFARST
ncbi:hypothetical protein ACOME3_004119 [Neoechinorhynchus agilis]